MAKKLHVGKIIGTILLPGVGTAIGATIDKIVYTNKLNNEIDVAEAELEKLYMEEENDVVPFVKLGEDEVEEV